MAVAKEQGREKPVKIEQRRGPQAEQTALLASPIYIGRPGGGKNKKRSQRAGGLSLSLSCVCALSVSLSLSLPRACTLCLSLSRVCALSVSLSLSLLRVCTLSLSVSLFLSCVLPRFPTLFSSRLWVSMPSCLEDGFSCYFLNNTEL